MENECAIFKFNSGEGALLCSGCSRIIKTGSEMSAKELAVMTGASSAYIEPQYNHR